jgi:cytochrome c biogenesis protein
MLVVGGKTNRAKLEFSQEMNLLLEKMPKLVSTNDAIDS